MSEELAKELIDAVKSSNFFSWEMMINILALIASWITIAFLLKEKGENNRPYAELIRSSLACILIRNVGKVPLSIKSLTFGTDFINQIKNFMVYISEIDELRSVNKEISKNIENNTRELKRIHTIVNKYANLGDSFSRCVVDKITEE